jgi:hypothetical protein
MAIGSEVSYRKNMPLVSDPVTVLPAALVKPGSGQVAVSDLPANGDAPGARGNTMHALINFVNVLPGNAFFDTASLSGELTFMRWLSVTQNEAVFKGRDSYVSADGSTLDKVTKNYAGLALGFTPQWFQVFPGVDLTAPISWQQGINGNAAVTLGGNRGAGTYSFGVAADIYQKYKATLAYTGYYGQANLNAAGGIAVANGGTASLADRGFVSLTLKATF